ncbi:MAG: sulfite exporter TauE/SafE family protein [Actinomycetota bacterium]
MDVLELPTVELVVIGAAAVATSVLSAMAGLGGGIILLVVIAQFFAPAVAIPVHGGIQLVSNGSRASLLRREIAWRPVLLQSLLLLPAALVGVAVATAIPEAATRLAIGVFVLVVAWRPSLLKRRRAAGPSDRTLVGVGAVSGFLNSTVGASGPVTSPFFKAATATHVSFVATAASTQVLAHLSKIIAYTLDDFSPADHLLVIAVGAVGVTAGSWIGTRLLGRVAEDRLDLLFKVVLTALAVRLVAQAFVG